MKIKLPSLVKRQIDILMLILKKNDALCFVQNVYQCQIDNKEKNMQREAVNSQVG